MSFVGAFVFWEPSYDTCAKCFTQMPRPAPVMSFMDKFWICRGGFSYIYFEVRNDRGESEPLHNRQNFYIIIPNFILIVCTPGQGSVSIAYYRRQ